MKIKEIINDHISLYKKLKESRVDRKDYKIVPKIEFRSDTNMMIFSILPVIIWTPWIKRYTNTYVMSISWFSLHLGIGLWKAKRKD